MRPTKTMTLNSNKRSSSQQITVLAKLSGNKYVLLVAGIFCLASFSVFPILLLENLDTGTSNANYDASVDHVILRGGSGGRVTGNTAQQNAKQQQVSHEKQQGGSGGRRTTTSTKTRKTKDGRMLPDYTLSNLDTSLDQNIVNMPVARGVAGNRNLQETPSVADAQRAHDIQCDINVDSLAYWNNPIGSRDLEFTSPFSVARLSEKTKYISFAPDRGGWNNVRMSMEIIFIIAAVTGRTLVLPPKEPLYLLHHDKNSKHKGFADFFPLHTKEFQNRVKVISFAEFLEREGSNGGELAPSSELAEGVKNAADHCDKRDKSPSSCKAVFTYLEQVGYNPEISAVSTCLIFDENKYNNHDNDDAEAENQEHIDTMCGPKRQQKFWDQDLQQHKLIHFRASEKEYRLLTHFYSMIHFTNPAIDHHYKRFVRDFLHYHDSIYCAAGKIVKAVQAEGVSRGFAVDSEGAGAFSALHVRRGDLQYKKVKISAQEWYDNTKEIYQENEILYIATDERDKSFFDDLAKHHDLRFLDDYWELAGLGDLDPNYMGMIDTIVASRGRVFAGTWFSTFSGYINRLRGYHGMSMHDSWYSFLPKKTAMHEWKVVDDFVYAFEYPDGWVGIDMDTFPLRDKF